MNANKADVGKKYLTRSGIPVTVVEMKKNKVVLKIETTGNRTEVDEGYELRPFTENGINKEARLLLKASGVGKSSGPKKERTGTLAAVIDPYLMAGKHTVAEIAVELKRKAGALATGKDLEANVRARLFSFRRKGCRVERDKEHHVRVVRKAAAL